ncbi:hypothetical protein H0H92_009769 [Tricholoma furcatifolium]|nr:hypothetical protein H0H92_009769 [Tricholoma furcatifolium]
MQFSFTATAVVVLAVSAFSGAAVVPRANHDHGLEARYYRGGHFAREIPAVPDVKVVQRRMHPRDFRVVISVD